MGAVPYWSSSGTLGEEEQGQPISGADVAEVPSIAFGKKGIRLRVIVRRVRPTPWSQLAPFNEYSYHALVTDRRGTTLKLEADHRRRAAMEAVIRDLKEGSGLAQMPPGRSAANAACPAFSTLASHTPVWVDC